MPTIINGSGSADFNTPLPVTEGGTGSATALGSGAPMLSPQTGSAPVYGCRAWCVFNGATAGTNAPTAGGNVSTLQRNGLGDYSLLFTTAMPDALYNVIGSGSATSAADTRGGAVTIVQTSKSTTGFRFVVTRIGDNGAGPVLLDCAEVSVAIFR